MLTPAELSTLDYTLRGLPYSDVGMVDVASLDYTLRGLPDYVAFGTVPYSPNMYAEFSVSASLTATLSTSVNLSASFSFGFTMSGYMNLGSSAKLVNIF